MTLAIMSLPLIGARTEGLATFSSARYSADSMSSVDAWTPSTMQTPSIFHVHWETVLYPRL